MDRIKTVESTFTIEGYYDLVKKLIVTPEKLTRPYRIFIDVNGVVLPDIKSEKDLDCFENKSNITTIDIDRTKVLETTSIFWWDSEIARALSKLSKDPRIDFVWLTDWRMNAPYAIDPLLDIESVGFLPWQRKLTDYNQSFKGVAIRELHNVNPTKFVWVDDRANRVDMYSSHYFSDFQDLDFDDDGNKIILSEDSNPMSSYYVLEDEYPDRKILATDYLNITTSPTIGITMKHISDIYHWINNNQ